MDDGLSLLPLHCTALPGRAFSQLAEQVRSIALDAAAALQLRDYGRIDFRVRASDSAVFVLEANPNPDITIDSGFITAAQASGRTHSSVICEIVERAKERAPGRDPRCPSEQSDIKARGYRNQLLVKLLQAAYLQ